MDQHVVSAWLLRSFAGRGGRGALLHVYDKALDTFDQVSIDDFLAETDAHSADVERDIGRIEGPAARAASNLAKRAKPLPGGLYAIVGPGEATRAEGPAISDKGVIAGMRLQVSEYQLSTPSDVDRLALANYAGLLYHRAPKVEAALEQLGVVYERAAQAVLDRLTPGMRSGLVIDINERRARMARNARNVGPTLAAANWWIVRAGTDESFVLGDNPVATTVSLGHDDSWRPILGEATYVVAMPLGPTLALVVAPKVIIPVTGMEDPKQAMAAINRLVWRSADRYVLARSRDQLEAAMPRDGDVRRERIPVDIDAVRLARTATGEAVAIVAEANWRVATGPWQHWQGHRLEFGFLPFPAEDRDRVMGPSHPAAPMRRSAGRRAPRGPRS